MAVTRLHSYLCTLITAVIVRNHFFQLYLRKVLFSKKKKKTDDAAEMAVFLKIEKVIYRNIYYYGHMEHLGSDD